MSCSVVTFSTPQEVVPEYCCALGKEMACQTTSLETGLENLTPSTTKPLPEQKRPHFPVYRGRGLWDSSDKEVPQKAPTLQGMVDVWKPSCS